MNLVEEYLSLIGSRGREKGEGGKNGRKGEGVTKEGRKGERGDGRKEGGRQ